jgi:cyclic-di-GMP-binding protein
MNKEGTGSLRITDLAGGLAYLSQLTLANPAFAERQLTDLLDALIAEPPPARVLFQILEQLRVPLCFVEEELALLYQNKAIPLGHEQERSFQMVVLAWQKIGNAYALCDRLHEQAGDSTDDAVENESDKQTLDATILQRCIYYTGMVILDHYRARRELSPGIWRALHGYYAKAEKLGLALVTVEDTLENSTHTTHCSAAYINLLLIELASPYSCSVRNLNLIRRWASMWASQVAIDQLDDDLVLPPYVIELSQDLPLHPSSSLEGETADVRRLDTTRLGLQIGQMLAKLRQRLTPSELGLGEEISSHVIALLEHLAKPWTQSAGARRFRRFATEGTARLVTGFETMYQQITGMVFQQPDIAAAYSRGQFEQLFTFGQRVDAGQGLKIHASKGVPMEEWSVINHSATGFRLGRSVAGQRINHGQLMAVCPHDGESFLLAYATWLMQEVSGGVIVGLSTLPGLPQGLGVRALDSSGLASSENRYTPAFMLPALPAMKEEASLVLPSGFYQAGRDLELSSGKELRRVRMNRILQRQVDFDRISIIDL